MKVTRIPVSKVLANVESVLLNMTDNPDFPTPNPTLSIVKTQKDELALAVSTAIDGSKAEKAIVPEKLRKLILTMRTLQAYVESIANSNANIGRGEQVVLGAGMAVKVFTPRQKRVFNLKNNTLKGSITAFCPRTKKDILFEFEHTLTPDDETSYISSGQFPSAKRIISDLQSCSKCYVRWASITSKGRGDWSAPKSITVT